MYGVYYKVKQVILSFLYGVCTCGVHTVLCLCHVQPIFTMSAQQQYLRQFTDDDYDRLTNEAKFAVSNCLLDNICESGFFE